MPRIILVDQKLNKKKKTVVKLFQMHGTCRVRVVEIQVLLDAYSSQGKMLVALTSIMKELKEMQERLDIDQARVLNL